MTEPPQHYVDCAQQLVDDMNAMLARKSWRPDMVNSLSNAVHANLDLARTMESRDAEDQ